jgi:polyisoprenoid-binding protein YceI
MGSVRRAWRRGGIVVLLLGAALLAACGSTATTATSTAQVGAPATATTTTAATASTAASTAGTAAGAASGATPTRAATPVAAGPGTTPTGAAGTARVGASPAAGATPASANAQRFAIVPNDSKATYHVNETLAGRGFNVAVGSTGTLAGDLYLDRTRPSASSIGTITVDISKLTSDQGQRDRAIRGQWLESNKFPQATFKATKIEGLPDTPYTDGQELTFKIVGDLTVRTVTKEVTFDATGKLEGDTFTGTATTRFNMTDFGFNPPEIAGIVKAENGVQLDLAIVAKRAA